MCEGKLSISENEIWLCQNEANGDTANDKLGFALSWKLGYNYMGEEAVDFKPQSDHSNFEVLEYSSSTQPALPKYDRLATHSTPRKVGTKLIKIRSITL